MLFWGPLGFAGPPTMHHRWGGIRRRLRLHQISGASFAFIQFLNSLVYIGGKYVCRGLYCVSMLYLSEREMAVRSRVFRIGD